MLGLDFRMFKEVNVLLIFVIAVNFFGLYGHPFLPYFACLQGRRGCEENYDLWSGGREQTVSV